MVNGIWCELGKKISTQRYVHGCLERKTLNITAPASLQRRKCGECVALFAG